VDGAPTLHRVRDAGCVGRDRHGTALFLRDGIVAPWLVLKLVAVAG